VLQAVVLMLLFLQSKRVHAGSARVVLIVPNNVVVNWLDELERWLNLFSDSPEPVRREHKDNALTAVRVKKSS
jgi:hypothetical protein